MPAEPWGEARRLLLACPGGQQVLAPAIPALRALQQALPAAAFTLWTPTCSEQLATQLPAMQELLRGPLTWSTPLRPLVNAIRNRAFDAAIILTGLQESPYPAAYVCYLAGVPLRLGQSREFGGSVLSHWVRPRNDVNSLQQHHRHLLQEAGLIERRVARPAPATATEGRAPG